MAVVEIHRPPNNYFDAALIEGIADAYERLDDDAQCRAIVLCAGKTRLRRRRLLPARRGRAAAGWHLISEIR
ncbi:hypothetical protein [Mycobacterium kansasii]|uniref:hypothetical protein n=1 Tax=Mycobacterium kansasii TaxID=1768 RepID=UPI000C072B80|nr:hypothetical protein [Mycobacterium kansasii]